MTEWLYPVQCPVCFGIVLPKGALIHPECVEKIEFLKAPLCKKCGAPVSSEEEEYCEECSTRNHGWDVGRSVFFYHGSVGKALLRVKKEGIREFVHFFGVCMAKSQEAFIRQVAPECIVPVPLHKSRQRSRGFNQAELLAAALGNELGLPVRLLLKKNKKTKDQKSLNRLERSNNVRDVFSVDTDELGEEIPNSVLLVDDVVTTGSTLSACALALKGQGVPFVAFLTVCTGERSR